MNLNLLEIKIKESGLKYQKIADALGISYYTLHKKLTGVTEFNASEIRAISDILNLAKEEKHNIFFG